MDRKIKNLLQKYKWLGSEILTAQKIIYDHLDIGMEYLESLIVKRQQSLINSFLPRFELLKQIIKLRED